MKQATIIPSQTNPHQESLKALIADGKARYSEELETAALALALDVVRKSDSLVLDSPVELLDSERITSLVSRDDVELEILWSIGSTNSHLMGKASDEFNGYRICMAEQQQAGRGRRGRVWVSPFGTSLYMSLACRFEQGSTDFGGLSLAVGIQVAIALRLCGVTGVGLKWPNDVMLNQGKLAGILVEIGPPKKQQITTVIGIGLNIRIPRKDRLKIDQPLGTLEGMGMSRNDLAGEVLKSVIDGLDRFAEHGFESFHQNWDTFDHYKGKEVIVHQGDKRISGVDAGVDASGNFLLQTSGGLQAFNAGEVSLRLERKG